MPAPETASTEANPSALAPAQDPPVKVSLKLEDTCSVLILAALALITLANVLVRYLSNGSIAWTEEISVFLLIVLTMTAGSSAFVRGAHIRIETLADGASPARKRRLAIISHVVVVLFFILMTVLSLRMVYDDIRWGDTSPAIGVPAWWYSIWMPVLGAVIVLRVVGRLQHLLRAVS